MNVGMGDVRKSSFLCDVSMAKLFVLERGLKIVTIQCTYTHTMYVGVGDVRKSSFLCDVSMAKLFILDGGLKIVNVRSRTHSCNVHGYG